MLVIKLQLYNTLSRRKEEFKPVEDNIVRIYVCGPTVYDHCHLGHFKTFVSFDFLVRYLRFKGFQVKYVMNITDVDDKIIRRANEKGVSIEEYTKDYIESFLEDMEALGLVKPDVIPKATEHINDMIKLIDKIIERGYAYVSGGNVYFDIERFSEYGKLSRISKDQMIAEEGEGKKNPYDFALWKAWKPGEPYWNSPWGKGRPGWHIECSAMSMRYLGETIDIHGGGSDLIFPHHENEIAQSEAATGKKFVRFWVHVGTLNFKMEKMSKSIGNVILVKEILKKYSPEVIRLYYFSIHYRRPQEFELKVLDQVSKLYERLRSTYVLLLNEYKKSPINPNNRMSERISEFINEFLDALDDDFNTPRALGVFTRFIRWLNSYIARGNPDRKTLADALYFYDIFKEITGILREERGVEEGVEELINLIIDVRRRLRERKIYDLSDYIREELKKRGVILEDRGLETKYKFIK